MTSIRTEAAGGSFSRFRRLVRAGTVADFPQAILRYRIRRGSA